MDLAGQLLGANGGGAAGVVASSADSSVTFPTARGVGHETLLLALGVGAAALVLVVAILSISRT